MGLFLMACFVCQKLGMIYLLKSSESIGVASTIHSMNEEQVEKLVGTLNWRMDFLLPFLLLALVCLCIWATWVVVVVVSHIVILFAHIFRQILSHSFYVHIRVAISFFSFVYFSPLLFTTNKRNEQAYQNWDNVSSIPSFDMKVNKKKILFSFVENGLKCWTFEQFERKDKKFGFLLLLLDEFLWSIAQAKHKAKIDTEIAPSTVPKFSDTFSPKIGYNDAKAVMIRDIFDMFKRNSAYRVFWYYCFHCCYLRLHLMELCVMSFSLLSLCVCLYTWMYSRCCFSFPSFSSLLFFKRLLNFR